jgi:hypothetical protein
VHICNISCAITSYEDKIKKVEKIMKVLKYLFATAAVVGTALTAHAGEPNDRAMDAVQRFIDSSRSEALQVKAANLSLGGDVRVTYKSLSEKVDGTQVRGSDAAATDHGGTEEFAFNDNGLIGTATQPVPANVFDLQMNMYMSYQNEKAFADTWLQYDNAMGVTQGVGSGTEDNIALKRALIGYHLMQDGVQSVDLMAGRDAGTSYFDSKVQHRMNLDGLFIKHNNVLDGIGNLSMRGSLHVIDQAANHWGWTGQVKLSDIADSGLSVRYTMNNQSTSGSQYARNTTYGDVTSVNEEVVTTTTTTPGVNLGDPDIVTTTNALTAVSYDQWKYKISELYISYDVAPEVLSFPVTLYGAYGMNHDAEELTNTNGNKKDSFFYAGANAGSLEKMGDWAVDFYYAKVEAQALPTQDISMNGRGNLSGVGTTTNRTTVATAASAAAVNDRSNFKGWTVEAGYSVTDDLVFGMSYFNYNAADDTIGTTNDFRQFQAELVYAF